jgi:DNA-binding winged helix-turn-helix (wHTH) protein
MRRARVAIRHLGVTVGSDHELVGFGTLVRAALVLRTAGRAAADALLAATLARHPDGVDRACEVAIDPATAMLRAALARDAAGLRPDQARLLEALALIAPSPPACDLVVDLTTGTIATPDGAGVRGRAVLSALFAHLVEAGGRPIGAEPLYRAVWRVDEYHPLRHRNTLYSAINRLRRILTALVPERDEVIATVPDGWCVRGERLAIRVVRRAHQDDARPRAAALQVLTTSTTPFAGHEETTR